MALDASQFDPSVLPMAVQRLNLDLDGNINVEGNLKGWLGVKKFKVESGVIRIIDRGTERDPQNAEPTEVLNVLRSQVSDKDVKLKLASIDGQPGVEVDVGGKNGLQLMIHAIGERARVASQVADAENARLTAFLSHWQTARQALGREHPRTPSILATTNTLTQANTAAHELEGQAEECKGDYTESRKVLERVEEMLQTLASIARYEAGLKQAASQDSIDLALPNVAALSVESQQEGCRALENRLTILRDKMSQNLDALTNKSDFIQLMQGEWQQENARVFTDIKVDTDRLIRNCTNPVNLNIFLGELQASALSSPHKATEVTHLSKILAGLEAITDFIAHMDREASLRGFTLSEIHELKNYMPTLLQEAKDKIVQLRDQLNARISFDDAKTQALATARRGRSPEDEGRVNNIEANTDDPQLDTYSARIQALEGEVNQNASAATLQAIRNEITAEIRPYLDHVNGLSTQMEGVYRNLIGQVDAKTLDGAEILRGLTERQNLHHARGEKAAGPLASAEAILQRIEGITKQRGDARTKFKAHRDSPRKKTYVERAEAAVRGSTPVQYLENEVGRARRERIKDEKKQEVVEGTCEVQLPGGFEPITFRADGLYHNITDAAGATAEEKITDTTLLATIVTALNDKKVRTTGAGQEIFTRPRGHFQFILNTDTQTVIRENKGDPAVLDRDRIRGIAHGVSPMRVLEPLEKEIGTVTKERLEKERKELVLEGSCVLTMPWGSGPVHFRRDGLFTEVDDGAGNFTEEKMTDTGELNDILEALNTGKVPADAPATFKPAARTTFAFTPEGGILRVTKGNPETGDADRIAAMARLGWNGVNKAVNKQMAKSALRNFVKDRGLPEYVGSLKAAGKTPDQIVAELELLLGGDNPAQAEVLQHGTYQQIYAEAARQQEILQKSKDRNEKVSEFVSKRKRNLKLLLPFTKEKEWLKWMDEKKIVRSIRKQREEGKDDASIRAGFEAAYTDKEKEELKQILDLAFERADDAAANKKLAAAFVKEKKMEEDVRKLIKDGNKPDEIRAALEAKHGATPNMSAAELKEIVDTAIERVESETRSATRWETTKKVLKTAATAAGIGVAGLGVGAGLLGLAGIYGVTKLAQGGLKLGGEVLHQVGDKGPKLAKAILPTIGGIIKAPFTMIASPFIGAWKGLKAGWNYPAKPQPKPAKGWTAPFRAIGNAFGWGWHKAKAAPTALATAALGLTLGGLWQGPGDAIVHDVLGVKTHMPVPAFMAPNGAPAPVAAPAAAPAAPAAGPGGH